MGVGLGNNGKLALLFLEQRNNRKPLRVARELRAHMTVQLVILQIRKLPDLEEGKKYVKVPSKVTEKNFPLGS